MKKACKSVFAIVLCFALLLPVVSTAFAAEKSYLIEESEGTKTCRKPLKFCSTRRMR